MWGNRRISLVRQTTFSECGLCCISMAGSYFGFHKPISYYRNEFNVGRDGINMASMIDVLSNSGIQAEPYHTDDFNILKQTHKPYIIHLKSMHYVVAFFNSRNVKVFDPSYGIYHASYIDFNKSSSGYYLDLETTSSFKKNLKRINDFRYIIPKVKQIYKLLFSIAILSISSYLLTLAIPLLMQEMIDRMTLNQSFDIREFMYLLFLIFLVFLTISFFYSKIFIKLQKKLYKSITEETVLHLFNVNYSYYDNRSVGNILFRTNILKEIQNAISSTMTQIIISISALIAMFVFLAISYTKIVILMSVILAIFSIIIFKLNKMVMFAKKEELASQEGIQNIITEIVSNMFQIRCIRITDYFKNNYTKFFDVFMKKYQISQNWTLLSNQFINGVITFSPAFIVLFIIILFEKTISVGQIFSIYTVLNNIFSQYLTFITAISSVLLLKTTLQYYNDMMDEPSIDFSKYNEDVDFRELQISNLWFKYNSNSDFVLKNINLVLQKGEKNAIVGASGSGKTTLIKLLMGLYEPTKGKIQIIDANQRIYEPSSTEITVLPQSPLIFNRTIRDNIILDNTTYTDEDVINCLKKVRIWNEIDLMPLKLDTIVSSQGGNLSGGQMQRIALARALIRKPKVIILDEATSSLDVENEFAIYKLLKEEKITQLIITHRLNSIEDSDRIYYMKEGAIIASGNHEKLLKTCLEYREICNLTHI